VPGLIQQDVPRADDLVERLRVATGIGVATTPSLPMECPHDLLAVGSPWHS